ncbi:MAG: GlcG/HbpS family heme-binding protein [Pseudonocardiaceae bacterium]
MTHNVVKMYATATITREAAKSLVDAARVASNKLGFEPATAVTDLGGHLKAFERGDSTPYLAGVIAMDKAWTAASYQLSTSYWNRYVQDSSVAALQNSSRVMPVGGGYAIMCDGQVIGAIAISGGSLEQDEKAALAALADLGFGTTEDPDAR